MQQYITEVNIPTEGIGMVAITAQVEAAMQSSKIVTGILVLSILHTSASLLVQENADKDVQLDLQDFL